MKLTLFRNGVSMATSSLLFKYLTIPRASQFSTSASPASEWKGGVSMVQGASRGIGLEFVKQLLEKNDEGFVVATCRCPSKSTGLKKLKEKYDQRLDIQSLDVTLEDTIKDTTDFIRDKYGFLNLLINASGIFSIPGVLQHGTDVLRFTGLDTFSIS